MKTRAKLTYAAPDDPMPKQLLIRSVERLTGRRRLERIYDAVLNTQTDHQQLWATTLHQLGVHVDYTATL